MGGTRRPIAVRSIAEMQAALAEEPPEIAPSGPPSTDQHIQEETEPPAEGWFDRLPPAEQERIRERWDWEAGRPSEWARMQARRRRRCAVDCALLTAFLAAVVELNPMRIGFGLLFGAAAGALMHASSRRLTAVLTFGSGAHFAAGSMTHSYGFGSPSDALFFGCEVLLVTSCLGVFAQRLHYRLVDGSDC